MEKIEKYIKLVQLHGAMIIAPIRVGLKKIVDSLQERYGKEYVECYGDETNTTIEIETEDTSGEIEIVGNVINYIEIDDDNDFIDYLQLLKVAQTIITDDLGGEKQDEN